MKQQAQSGLGDIIAALKMVSFDRCGLFSNMDTLEVRVNVYVNMQKQKERKSTVVKLDLRRRDESVFVKTCV